MRRRMAAWPAEKNRHAKQKTHTTTVPRCTFAINVWGIGQWKMHVTYESGPVRSTEKGECKLLWTKQNTPELEYSIIHRLHTHTVHRRSKQTSTQTHSHIFYSTTNLRGQHLHISLRIARSESLRCRRLRRRRLTEPNASRTSACLSVCICFSVYVRRADQQDDCTLVRPST